MRQLMLLTRALLLSLTLLLSGGCMTSALWDPDEVDEQRWLELSVTELVVDWWVVTGRDCSLEVASRGGVDRDGCSEWSLTPRDGGDITLALLQDPELLPNSTLRVVVQRRWEHADVLRADAEVEVTGALVLSQIGRLIDVATLSEPARIAHEAARGRPRFAFASTVSATPSDLLERCEQRLAALTLHHLHPPPAIAMTMVGATFVDAAGAPFQVPPNPEDRARTFAEELALLRDVRAIVSATDGRTQHTFELRMDRAWLWAALSRQPGGQVSYASAWTFCPSAAGAAADTASPPPSAATAQLRIVDITREWQKRRPDGGDLLLRVALTPIALVGDALIGWAFMVFDDEADETDPRQGEAERKRVRMRGRGMRR